MNMLTTPYMGYIVFNTLNVQLFDYINNFITSSILTSHTDTVHLWAHILYGYII